MVPPRPALHTHTMAPAAQFLRPPELATHPFASSGVDSPTGHAWALSGRTLLAWPIAVGAADAGSVHASSDTCLSVRLPRELGDGELFVQLLEPVRMGLA